MAFSSVDTPGNLPQATAIKRALGTPPKNVINRFPAKPPGTKPPLSSIRKPPLKPQTFNPKKPLPLAPPIPNLIPESGSRSPGGSYRRSRYPVEFGGIRKFRFVKGYPNSYVIEGGDIRSVTGSGFPERFRQIIGTGFIDIQGRSKGNYPLYVDYINPDGEQDRETETCSRCFGRCGAVEYWQITLEISGLDEPVVFNPDTEKLDKEPLAPPYTQIPQPQRQPEEPDRAAPDFLPKPQPLPDLKKQPRQPLDLRKPIPRLKPPRQEEPDPNETRRPQAPPPPKWPTRPSKNKQPEADPDRRLAPPDGLADDEDLEKPPQLDRGDSLQDEILQPDPDQQISRGDQPDFRIDTSRPDFFTSPDREPPNFEFIPAPPGGSPTLRRPEPKIPAPDPEPDPEEPPNIEEPPPDEEEKEKEEEEEMQKKLDRILDNQENKIIPELTGMPKPLTVDQTKQAVSEGICQEYNPGGCARDSENRVKANSDSNRNALQDFLGDKMDSLSAAISAINTFLNDKILSKLNLVSDKLGDQLPGGISGFLEKAWRATRMDKIINALNLAASLHNAAMLSNNLTRTMGDVASNILQTFGIKDEEDNPIDVNEVVGSTLTNAAKAVVGESVWNQTSTAWRNGNRIISTAAGLWSAVRGTSQAAIQGLEIVGGWVAQIGNSGQQQGLFEEQSFPWMNENPNFKDPLMRQTAQIDGLQNATEEVYEVTSATIEVQESFNNTVQTIELLETELEDAQTQKEEEEGTEKTNNTNPEITEEDLLRGEE